MRVNPSATLDASEVTGLQAATIELVDVLTHIGMVLVVVGACSWAVMLLAAALRLSRR